MQNQYYAPYSYSSTSSSTEPPTTSASADYYSQYSQYYTDPAYQQYYTNQDQGSTSYDEPPKASSDPAATAIVRSAAPTKYTPLTAYQYHEPLLHKSMTSESTSSMTSHSYNYNNANKRKKPYKRLAGGEIWEDTSLLEWDESKSKVLLSCTRL
jgi:hypothetical protein